MTRALQGLRVVEISKGMAGGLAGMVLADHGAEVVRIEAPRPDPYVSEAGSRLWNRGKQRIALDLHDPHQGNEARALASAADVVLVAVGKFHSESAIAAAHTAGQRDFGENRVQELTQKAEALAALPGLRWHMIGSLQTNKVRELLRVPGLALLHSLDRARLADALQHELAATGAALAVLLQLHLTTEASKHGCSAADAPALLDHVQQRCPNLLVEGLMAIGPLEGDPRPVFEQVFALRRALRQRSGLSLPITSLGMSGDLEAAIAAGSTMVRVGTDIFGARN